MANHHKPTKEELEESIRKTQEEIEKMDNPPAPAPSTPVPSPSQPIPSPSAPIPSPSEEIPEPTPSKPIPEKKEEKQEEPKPEEKQKEVDYKKRYSDSSREAQVQYAKNRKVQEAIDHAALLPEPTDIEMTSIYSNWDEMDAITRDLAKGNEWNKRKFKAIEIASQEGKDIDAWNTKVDVFVEDPKTLIKHKELEGKVEEFKNFAIKPTRRGVDFEDLVLAFSGELARNKPAPKKGQMFPTGSGGPNINPQKKDDRLSPEEGRVLMQNDYKRYREYLTAGKIKNE